MNVSRPSIPSASTGIPDPRGTSRAYASGTEGELGSSPFEAATAKVFTDGDGNTTHWKFTSWTKRDGSEGKLPNDSRNELEFFPDSDSPNKLYVRGHTKDRFFDGSVDVDDGKTKFGNQHGEASEPFHVINNDEMDHGPALGSRLGSLGGEPRRPDPEEVKNENAYIDAIHRVKTADVRMDDHPVLKMTTADGDTLTFTRE
jgi:hypothetical protein